ncbi:MAG: hypothetical protein APR56_08965 [Methanosaeta sp. SDB]|jgi:hypothetical protein|uniref:Uncharacterized protein n=1 Tax=Methanothrix harundinacea TaxID=301375 RepID=A0A101FTZ5_9EURY|nr:MAG: hypothetical protein APR56_08965 [Methanosaeta sp. SDB]KUK44316.1 MAG: Uncharacterized protein XD72_1316 [Methanothrix harundinacea]MCP1392690.1 hypothetical protein [Methanothrix harundinacea]
MFERVGNSWALVKASAMVLRSDRELLIYPIISAIALLIVSIAFFLPLNSTGFFIDAAEDPGVAEIVVVFAFYFVQYSVVIFANSALVGAALIRLRGGDPTLGDGFGIAKSHLRSILGYAAIAATVGMILKLFSQAGESEGRGNPLALIGALASSIVGMAWNLATFLAVPVLVTEDVGPGEAIRRSSSLLKKTWGEQVVGGISIGLVFGLFAIAAVILGIAAIVFVADTSPLAAIAIAILLVLLLLGIGLISSTLGGIYSAAVYNYAVGGDAGEFFREDLIKEAFRTGGRI